jgi:hypothetical protein
MNTTPKVNPVEGFDPTAYDPIHPEDMHDITIPVIALSGPIGCGKSTVSREFIKRHPDWVVINFADTLRETVQLVYGVPTQAQQNGYIKQMRFACFNNKTLREVLQFLGTEAFREISPTSWINAFNRKVQAAQNAGAAGVIVEDCRFINEAANLQSFNNGFIVYLIRGASHATLGDQVERHNHWFNRLRRFLGLKAYTLHESELQMSTMLNRADFVLPNSFNLSNPAGQDQFESALFKMLHALAIETAWFRNRSADLDTW